MKRRKNFAVVFLSVCLLTMPFALFSQEESSDVLATYLDKKLIKDDFKKILEFRMPEDYMMFPPDQILSFDKAELDKVIKETAAAEILYEEALDSKHHQSHRYGVRSIHQRAHPPWV